MNIIPHLLASGWLVVLAGCGFDSLAGNPQIFTKPRSHLTSTMTDGAIITSLNYARMKVRRVYGPDGYSTTYTTRGRKVFITRSLVSGVIVMESVPSGDRTWELGQE